MTAMTLDRAWPGVFTPAEASLLSSMQDSCLRFRPRQRILRQGDPPGGALYLAGGFAGSYRSDRFGRRQLLGIHVPGDYLDLSDLALGYLDHDLDAIDGTEIRSTPRTRLQALQAGAPDAFEKLWRIALIDAAIHRYWIFRLGRLVGRARIANFFCEMLLRLYARGLCSLERFDLPLTQADLAESCGMTPVHVNRMLAELREDGICTFSQGAVQVSKLSELFQMGQYSWNYLYLDPELDREIRERMTGQRAPAIRGGAMLRMGAGGAEA